MKYSAEYVKLLSESEIDPRTGRPRIDPELLAELKSSADELYDLYSRVKRLVRQVSGGYDSMTYERWKASGFMIDPDLVSMYPNLQQTIENLTAEAEEEYDDEPDGISDPRRSDPPE